MSNFKTREVTFELRYNQVLSIIYTNIVIKSKQYDLNIYIYNILIQNKQQKNIYNTQVGQVSAGTGKIVVFFWGSIYTRQNYICLHRTYNHYWVD